jgi:class 3 adenylate cyclase
MNLLVNEFDAFAMIVDINAYSLIVEGGGSDMAAQFTRDVLTGGIVAVEQSGGDVVGFMGDAFLAFLPTAQAAVDSCIGIACDLNKQVEYLYLLSKEDPGSYEFAGGGPSLKIGVEFGWIGPSMIHSSFLGNQRLFAGTAINLASRILNMGRGNRCHVGPTAAKLIEQAGYGLSGPFRVKGKAGEGSYELWKFVMDDIWKEGPVKKGDLPYLDG